MLIDGEKWACESCIRGHRTSNCQHNDRPLQQISNKGRPVKDCSRRSDRHNYRDRSNRQLSTVERYKATTTNPVPWRLPPIVGMDSSSGPAGTQSETPEINWNTPSSTRFPHSYPMLNFRGFESVASSLSTSETGVDSWSMSEASDQDGRLQPRNSSTVSNEAVNQLLSGFQDFRASSHCANRGADVAIWKEAADSEPESNQAGRKRELDTEDHCLDDDPLKDIIAMSDAGRLLTAKKSRDGDVSQQTLACPFWKRDPERHQRCGLLTLTRVRDVKQHLNRRHTPAFYCERCLVVFDSATDHESHMVFVSCRREPAAELNGISNAVCRKLRQKSDAKLSIADQWFAIWDLLFPGVSRPSSAFVDSELSVDLRLFSEYYRCRGSGMLMDLLNSNDVWSMSKEDQQARTRQIIEDGLNKIYDDWLISRSPGFIEAAPESKTTSAYPFPGQSPDPWVGFDTQAYEEGYPDSQSSLCVWLGD